MATQDFIKPIKSKWDARFLINTIMGILEYHQKITGDLVMGVVTAAVRSYSRGYMGKISLDKEGEAYWYLKRYALERVQSKGKDSDLMKAFLQALVFAEHDIDEVKAEHDMDEVEAEHDMDEVEAEQNMDWKLSAGFPLDSFTDDEVALVSKKSQEYFGAKFYCSDCDPRKGMLVFDDEEGLETFGKWIAKNHPELVHQQLDEETG